MLLLSPLLAFVCLCAGLSFVLARALVVSLSHCSGCDAREQQTIVRSSGSSSSDNSRPTVVSASHEPVATIATADAPAQLHRRDQKARAAASSQLSESAAAGAAGSATHRSPDAATSACKQQCAAARLLSSLEVPSAACFCPLSVIPVAAGSPPHWDPIDPAHGNTSLVLLSKDNPKHAAELAQVQQSWTQTQGNGSIASVHRVQNLTLWSAYEKKKAELQQRGSLTHSDAVVYHGTRHNPPELIHAGSVGFDPSKGASLIGHCWFAEHASYSSSYFSLVGSSTLPFGGQHDCGSWYAAVQAGPLFQGLKQIFQAQLTLTTGEYIGQRVFTVTHAARAYPQYLITFS